MQNRFKMRPFALIKMNENGGFIMFNIGWTELLLVLGVALVIFGPGKLPELGQTLGRAIREFKSAVNNIDVDIKKEVNDLQNDIRDVKEAVDLKSTIQDIQNDVKDAVKIDLDLTETKQETAAEPDSQAQKQA